MKHNIIALVLLASINAPALLAQPAGLEQLEFFIGKWDLKTTDVRPDGSFATGRARSEVRYILDGHAIQDDFLMLGEDDSIIFRGTSIRSYNPRTGKYQIVWIMPGIRGITDINAEWKDDRLVSTGKGYDGSGEFLERFEYYDITQDSYSFKMDRSYDGGKSWIENFSRIEAKRADK